MCCCNGFATHFVENGSIVMYVARDGFYKIGDGNFHDQLIPNQPQKKSCIKWHWVLRGGSIYKIGSTKWCGPTPPTLKTRWISILFCARPHPFCIGNWRGDSFSMTIINKQTTKNLFPTKKNPRNVWSTSTQRCFAPLEKRKAGVKSGTWPRNGWAILPPEKITLAREKSPSFIWGIYIYISSFKKWLEFLQLLKFLCFFWAGNNGTSICTNISPHAY